jgi:hypothetical protein
MTNMHDIYDPPPALEQEWTPPRRQRLSFTTGDLICLAGLCSLLFSAAILAWHSEPELVIATAAAGALVILESWLTAVDFLQRRRPLGLKARWTIFLAALIPWLVGLGITVSLILSLFWVSDLIS